MLRPAPRIIGCVAAAVALMVLVFVEPASADNKNLPPKPDGDYVPMCLPNGHCWWAPRSVVEHLQETTTPGKKPAKTATQHTKPVCQLGGAAQACTSKLGNWSNSQQCYLQSVDPQPPYSDPAWQGHTDGAIWACVREQGYDDGKHLVTKWVWLPGKPDTVVVDPVTLAYEAIAEMHLGKPLIKSAPSVDQIGLVNTPVWLWATKTENTWGPITRSASVPGLTVTATAKVKAINWSMGDGNTIRCDGPGTPYDKSMGIKDSPDCGHRYKKTSHELPDCKYPVAATAQWDISWQSTLGDSGQISLTQQAATQLRIGEAVPVLVDPDGGDAVAPGEGEC